MRREVSKESDRKLDCCDSFRVSRKLVETAECIKALLGVRNSLCSNGTAIIHNKSRISNHRNALLSCGLYTKHTKSTHYEQVVTESACSISKTTQRILNKFAILSQ
jgi:hypothetical protein